MNTDFANLLNNCKNRVGGADDDTVEIDSTKTSDNDSGVFTESENVKTSISNGNSPVRPEIKDIIEEKMKQIDDYTASPFSLFSLLKSSKYGFEEAEKEVPEEVPEKAKILFSLEDFFERSKKIEKSGKYKQCGEKFSADLDKYVDSLHKDGDELQDGDKDDEFGDDENILESIKSDNSEQLLKDSKISEQSDSEGFVEDSKGDDDTDEIEKSKEHKQSRGKFSVNHNTNIDSLDNDGDVLQDRENDNEFDEEGTKSDNGEKLLEDSKTNEQIDNKGFVEDSKGDDSDKYSDLESDVNPEIGVEDTGERKCDDKQSYDEKNIEEIDTENGDKTLLSDKGIDVDGSGCYPQNIDETKVEDSKDKTSKVKEALSILNNISISVVGGNSKNINLESLLAAAPEPSSFQTGPNISIKRKSANISPTKNDSKIIKLLSSDEEKSIPAVNLDEHSTKEDLSEDVEDNEPKENLAEQYNNCTHGDPMDYMCVECAYNRWRCERDFIRSRKVEKTESKSDTEESLTTKPKVQNIVENVLSEESSLDGTRPETKASIASAVSDIATKSEYFKKFPNQIKKCPPTDDRFVTQDPSMPEGWKYRELTKRANGRVDKEYRSPDYMVFRSRKAMMEYMKVLDRAEQGN